MQYIFKKDVYPYILVPLPPNRELFYNDVYPYILVPTPPNRVHF